MGTATFTATLLHQVLWTQFLVAAFSTCLSIVLALLFSGKINVKNDPKGKGYADAKAFFDKLNPSVNLIEADTTRHADRAHAVSGAFSSGTTLGGSLSVKGSTVSMSSKSWIDQLKEKHGVKLS